jgi:hypothetical protein
MSTYLSPFGIVISLPAVAASVELVAPVVVVEEDVVDVVEVVVVLLLPLLSLPVDWVVAGAADDVLLDCPAHPARLSASATPSRR